jgi:hypothetical protein
MTEKSRTFAFGTLEENGDTWLLITRDRIILLDLALSDLTLEHKTVSVVGKMGIPPSSFDTKLIVEKLVTHDEIALRAFDLFKSGVGGSQDDQWFRAERELLNL